MDILDWLGLRSQSPAAFTEWLGGQLERLFPAAGPSDDWDATLGLLAELDERIQKFSKKHGVPVFEEAVRQWAERSDPTAVTAATRMLHNEAWMTKALFRFDGSRGHAAAGVMQLRQVSAKIVPAIPTSAEAGDPVAEFVHTIRCFERDKDLLNSLTQITGQATDTVWREVIALRLFGFRAVAASVLGAETDRRERLEEQIRAALARGESGAERASSPWLFRRVAAYGDHEARVQDDGRSGYGRLNAGAGRTFASQLESSREDVQRLGTTLFNDVINRSFDPLMREILG